MASSSGQGVAAVMPPRFSTTGDPRRNCEKFIQMFKDWCELNGWYVSEPPPEAPEEGADSMPHGGAKVTCKRESFGSFPFRHSGRIQNMERGPWTTPWTRSMDYLIDLVHGPGPWTTPNFQRKIAPVNMKIYRRSGYEKQTRIYILLYMRCQNSPGCSFIRLILMLYIQSYFKMNILNIILIVSFLTYYLGLICNFRVLQSVCK